MIFLTLFFALEIVCYLVIGKPHIEIKTIIGSYLLLNGPSIGYVWIMRVFLLMALMLPMLGRLLKDINFMPLCVIIFGLIGVQQLLIEAIGSIDNKIINFILDEIVLYAIGYAPIAILGLKIAELSPRQLLAFLGITLCAIICFVWCNDMVFQPKLYKYPPQSLYLLYGLFGSALMWSLKPVLAAVTKGKVFRYLSENSMWIYLWHIIPVYAITPWANVTGMWFGRFCFVLAVAIILNLIYANFTEFFKGQLNRLSSKKSN
ncbi:MAG: acyltransferase family protein [Staphylococcus sp.]|nr:acyltransferase family protein [Staphylococcus sp.]